MEEALLLAGKEIVKTGILGCIIAFLLVERYLKDVRNSGMHQELNESIHELIIKIEAVMKV